MTAAWAVAFDRLAAADPTALQLLTLIAWLGPEPVPLTLLTNHPEPLPPPLARAVADLLALTRHTTTLRRRGLATRALFVERRAASRFDIGEALVAGADAAQHVLFVDHGSPSTRVPARLISSRRNRRW